MQPVLWLLIGSVRLLGRISGLCELLVFLNVKPTPERQRDEATLDHWQAAGLIDTGKLQSFYECFGWIADNGPGSQSHRDRTQNVMDMQKSWR
jgi:hypothetical protein